MTISRRVMLSLLASPLLPAAAKPRARDLGIPFEGEPGPYNAITDVAGVEVGHVTLISGSGRLERGKGPVRTGVTAIVPRGKNNPDPVFAGWFAQNGNGEMTGTTWIEESGFLEGPVMITNTHSVGVVRDAVVAWQVRTGKLFQPYSYPVVAETFDGRLNDVNGFHVTARHAVEAIETARGGPPLEGNAGGGAGMVCFGFKGGAGTASRVVTTGGERYTLGVQVQANFGQREQLRIAGVPVGAELARELPPLASASRMGEEMGSIIIVAATDAPLLSHQLKRIARRITMGLARTGSTAGNGSGDIFLAFSTANPGVAGAEGIASPRMLPNRYLSALFDATVQATEEAILNALMAAETMTGVNDRTVIALPHDRVREILRRYNRLR